MVLAIVKKELREIRLFAVLAIGLYVVYLGRMTDQGGPMLTALLGYFPGMSQAPPEIPFVYGIFTNVLAFIGISLAIALGFRQSAWEPSQGTALYLLHLPLSRRKIYLTKLATGIMILLACTVAPILAYALWAATPGTHPGPFEWSMTGPAFRAWLVMPLVYLGAFASGIRPGRWFGSRLLPLVAVAVPAILANATPYWWTIGVPLIVLTTAALLSNIIWIAATRDY